MRPIGNDGLAVYAHIRKNSNDLENSAVTERADAQRGIAVITTGGTIGSMLGAGGRTVDPKGAALNALIDALVARQGLSVEYLHPLNKISEDMAPADWGIINNAISGCLDKGIGRIVVTHGTDTLPYSITAAAAVHGGAAARICFTGSYYGLDHADSDVGLSLEAAISAVTCDDIPNGVFAVFRDGPDNRGALLHHPLRLKLMDPDSTFFESLYGDTVASFTQSGGWCVNRGFSLGQDGFNLADLTNVFPARLNAAAHRVALASAYPGMDLSRFAPSVEKPLDGLIISLYHSGTGSSGPEAGAILDFMAGAGKGLPVLLAQFPTRRIETPYESTTKLVDAGARLYGDLMPHHLYVFLTYGLASGLEVSR